MNLENIGKDCPCYEFDCSDIMFDIGEFCGLPPNNGKLTIQVNGSTVGDFSANQQEDETINITTPTSQDIADAVAGEALLRERADRDLQSQIDAIASKSDVVDVVGTYAELQAYDTSKLNDNDVVKVLDDSTHNDTMTYYRWNKTTQTWSYIGQESPYYSKSQMDTLLATKQNNLTAGNGIDITGDTISADTTVLATKNDLDSYAEKSNTYTKSEVDNLVEPKLSVEMVESLPAVGEESKLYLTPKAHTTQTATGNPISATITDGAGQIEDFQLDGDTYQQSYSGKNLFVYGESSAAGGLSVSYNAQTGGMTVQGTTTSNYPNISMGVNSLVTAGTYTMSITQPLSVNLSLRCIRQNDTYPTGIYIPAGQTNFTFTLDFTPKRIDVFYSVGATGVVVPETTFYLQIEAGSSATDYEPFVGGIASPNPDYPQPIQVVTGEQTVSKVGKNLFDKDKALDNYFYTSTGSKSTYSKAQFYNNKFVPTGDKITMSFSVAHDRQSGSNIEANVRIVQYDASGNFISRLMSRTNGHTFTLDANTKSFILCIDNGPDAWFDDLQIEYGSSATTYTPYSKTDYPISLGSIELCKLGTYQDYIYKDGDDWKIHKATDRLIFTKAITSGLSKQSLGFVYNAANNPLVGHTTTLGGFCSHFSIENTTTAWTGLNNVGISSIGALWFMTTSTSGGDTRSNSQFASWLADSEVAVYYVLATATDTVITDATLISQLDAIASASLETGTNTITNSATGSNLAGDMEVDYFGYDPTNRYDKWLWLDINNAYEKLGS